MIDIYRRLIETRAAQAKSHRQNLATELERVRAAEAAWQCVLEAYRYGHSAAVVILLRDRSEVFSRLRDTNENDAQLIESLHRDSKETANNTARRFATLFPAACEELGVKLDSTSRHPRYSIREFIQTTIDERRLEARVTPRDADSVTMPLDIDPLVSYLHREIDRLFHTQRDHKRLLQGLRTAYEAILRVEKKAPGYEIPLRRVTNRLSKNWKHFRYDEFNVDLGNTVRSGQTSIDCVRLHLNHTRDTRQGMLLYRLERSGYIGFLSFKPEKAK